MKSCRWIPANAARRVAFVAAVIATLASAPSKSSAAGIAIVPATATTPQIPVYIASPRDAGKYPAVLLLHGCDGFNGFLAVAADRLAARGYVGVALDSLGPNQDRCGPAENATLEQTADALAVLAWLSTQPNVDPTRMALVGFSMGGASTLNIIDPIGPAQPLPAGLRAAAAYYPWCGGGRDGKVRVPFIIFDGDADKVTPAAECAAMVRAGKAAGKTIDITTYPGATHGFTVPGPDRVFFGEPIRFDPEAAADSAQKLASFLAQYLK
jgi:dienelactone hydrolase